MTQSIRDFTNTRFAKFLPKFTAGEMDGKAFRGKVITDVVAKFEISSASAATHYNHALKMQRLADPESVATLGRPEGKKGGRPVLHPVTVVNARSGKVVAEGISRGAADVLIAKAGVLKSGANKLTIQEAANADEVGEAAEAA
jgi:hypothetical protein